MTLNKFEKRIGKALKEREIKPSDQAWKKVAEAMDRTQPKSKNSLWYGIAAGFTGLLLVSAWYFTGEGPFHEKYPVANTPTAAEAPPKGSQPRVAEEETAPEIVPRKAAIPAGKTDKNSVGTAGAHDERQAPVNLAQTSDGETVLPGEEVPEAFIDAKVAEVMAKVTFMERDKEVTEREVDSLLHQAHLEILAGREVRDVPAVDAAALLTEVEDELDESFREQIFDKLKLGFKKVRTAVADRNN